jgi:class 3 adenylate cyclase
MTATGLSCRSCGTDLNETAKFCPECGAAVSAAPNPAEFKQVTVLFADVVRSMDIAAAVGAERLREIMAELVSPGAAVVRQYGGTMEKFTGDGLMALFGAPVALEDHAIRACLAALAIQEETNRLAAEVQRRDGVDLRLRVGLNSGRVVAGEIGPGVWGYAAIGEQVGLAQRMESVELTLSVSQMLLPNLSFTTSARRPGSATRTRIRHPCKVWSDGDEWSGDGVVVDGLVGAGFGGWLSAGEGQPDDGSLDGAELVSEATGVVGQSVAFADVFDLGCDLGVAARGHVREDVVFDLVAQVARQDVKQW